MAGEQSRLSVRTPTLLQHNADLPVISLISLSFSAYSFAARERSTSHLAVRSMNRLAACTPSLAFTFLISVTGAPRQGSAADSSQDR